jgi:hypothetical protein
MTYKIFAKIRINIPNVCSVFNVEMDTYNSLIFRVLLQMMHKSKI